MKILITGAAGFIGSHLFNRLQHDGYKVYGIDNLSRGKIKNLRSTKNFFKIDVNKYSVVNNFLKSKGPFSIVVHQASIINENVFKENIEKDININCLSTINLLKNSYKYKTRKFIYASSVAVYGNNKEKPVSESSNTYPITSYGITKLATENYIKYLCKNLLKNMKYNILRYSNIYGPNQGRLGEVGVIRTFLERLKLNKNIYVHGSGFQTRDYLYIDDCVEVTIKCFKLKKNLLLNICSGKSETVNKIVNTIKKITKKKINLKKKGHHPGELFQFSISNIKAKKKLGWKPRNNLYLGIKKTYKNESN